MFVASIYSCGLVLPLVKKPGSWLNVSADMCAVGARLPRFPVIGVARFIGCMGQAIDVIGAVVARFSAL